MKFLIKNKESCGHNINRIQVYKSNSEKFNFFMGVRQILLRKELFQQIKNKELRVQKLVLTNNPAA